MDKLKNTEHFPPFLIFSVDTGSEADSFNRKIVTKYLIDLGIPFKNVHGVYKDVLEDSFIVPYTQEFELLVKSLCFEYRQEFYLSCIKGKGRLHYADGSTKPIGRLIVDIKPVDKYNFTVTANGLIYSFGDV